MLGAGGTMAILAAAGARLRLVALTDGEAWRPATDPAVIAATRAAESAAALDLLGVRGVEVLRLGLPDTGLAAHGEELAVLLAGLCAGWRSAWPPGKVTRTPTTRPRAARPGGPPSAQARPC